MRKCTFEGCDHPAHYETGRGYCNMHEQRDAGGRPMIRGEGIRKQAEAAMARGDTTFDCSVPCRVCGGAKRKSTIQAHCANPSCDTKFRGLWKGRLGKPAGTVRHNKGERQLIWGQATYHKELGEKHFTSTIACLACGSLERAVNGGRCWDCVRRWRVKDAATKKAQHKKYDRPLTLMQKAKARAQTVWRIYTKTLAQIEAMYVAQNGRCWNCGKKGFMPYDPHRSPGRGRCGETLCIDHDHSCCPGTTSCGFCVTHLYCAVCNMKLLNDKAIETALILRAGRGRTTNARLETEI